MRGAVITSDAFVRLARLLVVLLPAAALVSCEPSVGATAGVGAPLTLRLGYFPNLTHATALIGVKKNFFSDALGPGVTLETHTFNAGGDAVTAILSGAIDATFIGPNPTTNAFARSRGEAVRVIAGATSGGAMLVVRPAIAGPSDLKGKRIADPQLGGTQDVALRWYLRSHGLQADTAGGGDVHVLPQDNAQTLNAFKQGAIDGAWLPEPWASRLIVQGGAKILVDERDLWPQGRFVTTNLVVATQFLHEHGATVKALLEGLYAANQYINSNPAAAESLANEVVAEITGARLPASVVSLAWKNMTFTTDPLPDTLRVSAQHAKALGLVASSDVTGMYDLTALNQVLEEHGQPKVTG